MRQLADIAEQFSGGRLMVTHRQNIVLRSVHRASLYTLYRKLHDLQLTEGAFDAPTDLIACPGLDYCSLASARWDCSRAARRLRDKLDTGRGRIHINISGCINACGHHHVGTIGIWVSINLERNSIRSPWVAIPLMTRRLVRFLVVPFPRVKSWALLKSWLIRIMGTVLMTRPLTSS